MFGLAILIISGLYLLTINITYAQNQFSPSDVSVTIDESYPIIIISHPTNTNYNNATPLSVNFSIIEISLDSIWYWLNNGMNISINGNFTLNLPEGSYRLRIYANDSLNRINFSEVNFTINNSINFCGNFVCNQEENCISCPQDCGSCPPSGSSGGSGGSSGGGSGGGGSGFGAACISIWQCSDWSNPSQLCGERKCIDINNCIIQNNKPIEILACPTNGSTAPQTKYCGDGFCSDGENESTCNYDCEKSGSRKLLIIIIFILIISAIITLIIIILTTMIIYLKKLKRTDKDNIKVY